MIEKLQIHLTHDDEAYLMRAQWFSDLHPSVPTPFDYESQGHVHMEMGTRDGSDVYSSVLGVLWEVCSCMMWGVGGTALTHFGWGALQRSRDNFNHETVGWFNVKGLSYWCRDSDYTDERVVRLSHLYNGNSYTDETTSLYWVSP